MANTKHNINFFEMVWINNSLFIYLWTQFLFLDVRNLWIASVIAWLAYESSMQAR